MTKNAEDAIAAGRENTEPSPLQAIFQNGSVVLFRPLCHPDSERIRGPSCSLWGLILPTGTPAMLLEKD